MTTEECFVAIETRLHRLEAGQEARRQQIVAILGGMSEQAKITADHASKMEGTVSISLIRIFTHRGRAGSLFHRARHRPLDTACPSLSEASGQNQRK